MGCVSDKPNKDTLQREGHYLEEQRHQKIEGAGNGEGVETAARKEKEENENEEPLRDSGKPAWNNQQFLSLPEVEGKPL